MASDLKITIDTYSSYDMRIVVNIYIIKIILKFQNLLFIIFLFIRSLKIFTKWMNLS